MYVVGDATTAGWTAENAIPLTKVNGENKYKIENIPLVPGGEGFKFLTKRGDWSNALVNAGENKLAYYVDVPNDKDDIKFTVEKKGCYDLVVDFDNFTVTIKFKTEFPKVLSYNKEKTYEMLPTGNEGEFKAAEVYIGSGSNYHDFFIQEGDNAYHAPKNAYTEINKGSLTGNVYTCTVEKDNQQNLGWWIKDEYHMTQRLYDFTLNTKTNTLTLNFTQGKNFWIIGYPFGGFNAEKKDKFKATADEYGIVTWEVTTTETGEWKICGEYNLSEIDKFWEGEWYYSNAEYGSFDWSWTNDGGGNNYTTADANKDGFDVRVFCGDQKWKFNEPGTFRITFDSKNLKIKVEKL